MAKNFYLTHVVEMMQSTNCIFDTYEFSNDDMIVLRWRGGDNLNEINIYVSVRTMDSGSILVSMSCYDFSNFSNHYAKGLIACNQLNNDELVKYYIDEEGDAASHTTLLFNAYGVSSSFSPEQVLITASMMALSADDAYAVLEKSKWSD